MNLGSLLIDGVVLLAKKIDYKSKKSTIRLYTKNSPVPEKVLHEDPALPGTFIDEVENKVYTSIGGRLSLVNI